MKKILFVCTGNTCRSSMAEAIFNNIAKEKEDLNMKAESAGIEAIDGMPANDKAILTLKHRSVDMSAHKSRRIRSSHIEENDLVLAMTRLHKIQLLTSFPKAQGKVFTLLEYAGETSKLDVADPYGQSHEVYERCADDLEKSIRAAIEKLEKE